MARVCSHSSRLNEFWVHCASQTKQTARKSAPGQKAPRRQLAVCWTLFVVVWKFPFSLCFKRMFWSEKGERKANCEFENSLFLLVLERSFSAKSRKDKIWDFGCEFEKFFVFFISWKNSIFLEGKRRRSTGREQKLGILNSSRGLWPSSFMSEFLCTDSFRGLWPSSSSSTCVFSEFFVDGIK